MIQQIFTKRADHVTKKFFVEATPSYNPDCGYRRKKPDYRSGHLPADMLTCDLRPNTKRSLPVKNKGKLVRSWHMGVSWTTRVRWLRGRELQND